MNSNEIDLRRIFHIILRKKLVVLASLLLFLVPVYMLNKYSTPVFSAKTKIVFDQSKGGRQITESYAVTSENIIINQIEEIQSRSMARDVVLTLPDSIKAEFTYPIDAGPNFNEQEYLVGLIKEGIVASSVQGSDVINIEVNTESPLSSMFIANRIADVLVARNLEVIGQEASNVRTIINDNLERYKRDLDEAELRLREFKEENKLTEISQQGSEILRRITEAENLLNQTITNLNAAQERQSFITQRLAEERKDLVPAVTKTTSTRAQRMREELINLEDQYTRLSVQDYPADHPKMVELRTQINEISDNLRDETLRIASGENTIDPLSEIQRLLEESITLDIDIKAYEAQQKALDDVISNYEQNLNTMPAKELRLAQLMRDKAVSEEIYTMLLSKREEAKIAEAEISGNIRIIDKAILPDNPIRPRKMLNLIVGFVLGMSCGVGLALALEFFDDKIKKAEDAERVSELNLIGSIPEIKTPLFKRPGKWLNKRIRKLPEQSKEDLITLLDPQSPESEAFRSIRTNLNISDFDSAMRIILVTSSNPNEGKSFISSNMAVTTAQMGLKTLLIDADLRKPVLHHVFERELKPGLAELIINSKNVKVEKSVRVPRRIVDEEPSKKLIGMPEIFDFDDELHERPIDDIEMSIPKNRDNGSANTEAKNQFSFDSSIVETGIDNLDLLPCGEIPKYPSEVLGSRAMKNLLFELNNVYDVIFLDTPPINVVTDAGILGSIVDGAVLVIKAGSTSQKELQKAKSLLKKSNTKISGLIVNYLNPKESYTSYYYSYFNESKALK